MKMNDRPEIREAPLITVKQISRKHVEQLYGTRGELCDQPDGPGEHELAVGELTAGVLIRNMSTGRLRMVWPHRYLISLGLCFNRTPEQQQARKEALEKLPQIFIG